MANIKGFGEDALIKALDDAGITNDTERAMFLSQMAHETGNFKWTEELASGDQYEGRADLGNVMPGDGSRYKGRGFIQITGRDNYRHFGDKIGLDLESNPELAKDPEVAAKIAIEYWKERVNREAAQNGDVLTVTKNINGGINGLEDRANKFENYYSVMSQKKSPLEAAQEAETFSDGSGTGLQEASEVVASKPKRSLLDELLFPAAQAKTGFGSTATGKLPEDERVYIRYTNPKWRGKKLSDIDDQQIKQFVDLAAMYQSKDFSGVLDGFMIGLGKSEYEKEALAARGLTLDHPGVEMGILLAKGGKGVLEAIAAMYTFGAYGAPTKLMGSIAQKSPFLKALAKFTPKPFKGAAASKRVGNFFASAIEAGIADGSVNLGGQVVSDFYNKHPVMKNRSAVLRGSAVTALAGGAVGAVFRPIVKGSAKMAGARLASEGSDQVMSDAAEELGKINIDDAGKKAHQLLTDLAVTRSKELDDAGALIVKSIDDSGINLNLNSPVIKSIKEAFSKIPEEDIPELLKSSPAFREISKLIQENAPVEQVVHKLNPVTMQLEQTVETVVPPKILNGKDIWRLHHNLGRLAKEVGQSPSGTIFERVGEIIQPDKLKSVVDDSLTPTIKDSMNNFENIKIKWGDPWDKSMGPINNIWDAFDGQTLKLTPEQSLDVLTSPTSKGTTTIAAKIGEFVDNPDIPISAREVTDIFKAGALKNTSGTTNIVKPGVKGMADKFTQKASGNVSTGITPELVADEFSDDVLKGKYVPEGSLFRAGNAVEIADDAVPSITSEVEIDPSKVANKLLNPKNVTNMRLAAGQSGQQFVDSIENFSSTVKLSDVVNKRLGGLASRNKQMLSMESAKVAPGSPLEAPFVEDLVGPAVRKARSERNILAMGQQGLGQLADTINNLLQGGAESNFARNIWNTISSPFKDKKGR